MIDIDMTAYPDLPCPFKVGDRICLKQTGEQSTVIRVFDKGFDYTHEPWTFCHPLVGTSSGGTCYSNGYDAYELATDLGLKGPSAGAGEPDATFNRELPTVGGNKMECSTTELIHRCLV